MGLDIPLMAALQERIVTSDFWLQDCLWGIDAVAEAARVRVDCRDCDAFNQTWRVSRIGRSAAQHANRFHSWASRWGLHGVLTAALKTCRHKGNAVLSVEASPLSNDSPN